MRISRLFLAGAAMAVLGLSAAQAEPVKVTFLHINDHDRMAERDGRGGFAKVMSVIRQEQASNPGTVLVSHGGDAISPSLMAGIDHGVHMIDLLNQMPITVFVPGNHEYDFGPDVARQRFAEAKFPVLATNTSENGPLPGTVATHIVEVGPYKIGFFGLTTPSTEQLSSPGSVSFKDLLETAAATAKELREQGAHIVAAVAHTGIDEDFALIRQGAVDLILGGHDHHVMNFYNGKVAYVESGEQGDYVTALDLTIDTVGEGDKARVVWKPSFRTIDTVGVAPDPEMAAKVQTYLDQLSAELDVEIGVTETALDSRRATIRTQEAAIGNLIADAIRDAMGTDVAIANGGGIRAEREYEPGTKLTRRDIQAELPFGNRTVMLEVTGAQLLEALENGFSQIEKVGGRFPQVSGMNVVVNTKNEPGKRVEQVTIGGQPLDPAKTYTLATNDYVAGGGDGYSMLRKGKMLIDPAAAKFDASQVIDYISRKGTVAPKVEGRIVLK